MAIQFNFFKQLTKQQKQRIIAGALMLIAGSYAYVRYLWKPWSERIADDRKQIAEVRSKIATAQQEAKHLELLEKDMQALNAQTQESEKRLPKNRDMPAVFDAINRLTQRYRVQLVSFTPGAVNPKTYFTEIAYQIVVTGKYHDMGRFLASIATEERIYNVRDVTFAAGSGEDKKLNVNFTLLTYQYKG